MLRSGSSTPKIAVALLFWLALAIPSYAQNVTVIGPITAGDCPQFNSTTVIKDSHIPCNGSGSLPIVVGTTPINSGTNNAFLYDNGGTLGNLLLSTCNIRPSNESSYNVAPTDNYGCIVVTNVTAIETVNLPNAATNYPFQVTIFVQSGQVTSTVPAYVASAGGTINKQVGPIYQPPYEAIIYWSDDTNWNMVPGANMSDPWAGGLVANSVISYSPATEGGALTISLVSTCSASAGDVIGFNYSSTGFSPNPIQFRHTMTSASTCLADAATDLASQYKTNAQIINAYGADIVSYSVGVQSGNNWAVDLLQSWPAVVTGSPSISAVSGTNTNVSASGISTNVDLGGDIMFAHSTKILGRTMIAGDGIGGMVWCADTTAVACDPRDQQPIYGELVGTITNTSPSSPQAQLVSTFHTNTFVGEVGINNAAQANPTAPLDVMLGSTVASPALGSATLGLFQQADGASAATEIQTYGTGSNPGYGGVHARGTAGSPTAVHSGDSIVQLGGYGYDGTAFEIGTLIDNQAAGTWSHGSNQASQILFETTPSSSTTLTEAMRLQASGGLSVGTTTDPGIGQVIAKNGVSAGVAGTSLGAFGLSNTTSGTITLQPPTGALGSPTITVPAITGTMTVLGNSTTGSGNIVLATSPSIATSLAVGSTGTLSNTTELITGNAAGNSGTQTGTTTYLQVVSADGVIGGMEFDAFQNGGSNFPFIGFRTAGGTAASKSAAAAGTIGEFAGVVWDGSTYAASATVAAVAVGTQSTSNHGSNVIIQTTPSSSTSTATALTIFGSTGVAIGTATDPGAGGLIASGATIKFTALANAAANEILCYATASGLLTYENSVAGCVPSDPILKIRGPDLIPSDALAKIDELKPGSGVFKPEAHLGDNQQIWLYADQVCAMDDRLCVRDSNGILNYDKVGMLAYTVAAIKELHHEIEGLRR